MSKAKFNKNLVKSKKSNFVKVKINKKLAMFKKPDFAKAKFPKTDFLISEARFIGINLQKVFTKAPILYYFNSKDHIKLEIDVLEYIINRV